VVGIFAFAVTTGALASIRDPLLAIGVVDLGTGGRSQLGVGTLVVALAAIALTDQRLRRRPRMLASALLLGLAVAVGWLMTSRAVDAMALDRPESLTFVAPVGRALLQFMAYPFRNVGFGVATVCGVLAAASAVAVARRDFRWEAFDDAHEMRRHLLGACLMGTGGVLAQGCTIGQGLSAASVLSLSAPLFVIGLLVGAKLGLRHLIEGSSVWRLGRTPS
jgi:uncharacterized protein